MMRHIGYGWLMAAGIGLLTPLADRADEKPLIPAESWAKVEDDKPLRSAADNPGEYAVVNALILQSRRLTPEVLAKQAVPGVTARELIGPERTNYRGRVVHVVGRLLNLRAVESNGFLAAEGVKRLYEAWIRDDTTPENPVCVLVSELPPDLKPGKEFKNVWVTLDGYFIKRLQQHDVAAVQLAPLIVGRALRRNDGTTETPAKTLLEQGDPRLDCPAVWLEHIEDDVPVQTAKSNPDEYNAYNYFVLHARKVPPELLAKFARPELTFRVLFQADRGKYRGEIVHIEGKLLRLEWIGSNSALEAAGIKDLWEAWIFEDGADGNPICVVLTELPPGIKPAPVIHDTRASFDGYFFKRYKYKAQDAVRLAPLAIGRTLKVFASPPPTGSASTYENLLSGIVPIGVGLVIGVAVVLVGLTFWFRRGDRKVKERLNELKSQSMFREPPAE